MHWLCTEGLAVFIVNFVLGGVIFSILLAIAIRLDKRKKK